MNRPNILIIYTDQQRWDGLGANGNRDILTPNLDRLAAEGVNFDHCFAQNPVCMPSRVSFLTGQYPSTLGITHMGVPVPEETVTLPRLLRPCGYYSANIGKLHFLPHANRNHRTRHPDYGFDLLEISDEPGTYEDAYRAWVRRRDPRQLPLVSAGSAPMAEVWYKTMGIQDTVEHPDERFPLHPLPSRCREEFTHTAFVADQTIDFMRRQNQAGQPFLCIAGIYSPHSPWLAPQRYFDQYDRGALAIPAFPPEVDAERGSDRFSDAELRGARQGYYGQISEVDHHVGRMLDAIESMGIAENTIVLFTSDHGEWLGEHLRYGKGYPAHDQCSRVPLILRWPGEVDPGRTVSHLVEGVDVLPTLLQAIGAQIPPHLQGDSLWDCLRGDGAPLKSGALTEHTGWKSFRTERFRYVAHADGREFLYDLDQEWGDYRDVSDRSEYAGNLAEVRKEVIQRLIEMERPRARVWPY